MPRPMPLAVRAPLVLGVICLLAAGSLALLELGTRQRVARVRAEAQLAALAALTQRGAAARPPDTTLQIMARAAKEVQGSKWVQRVYHFPAAQREGQELWILALRSRGYGGPLSLLAAYRSDRSLYHAVMLEHHETPGFGKRAEDPNYMQVFWDRTPSSKRQLTGPALDAVSSSTITFDAIAQALEGGAAWLAGQTP